MRVGSINKYGCLLSFSVVSKIGGAIFIRENLARRIVTGMAMVPRGEVGLIFAELGRTTKLLNNEIYTTLVVVIADTTLFTPFWLRLFYKNFGQYLDDGEPERDTDVDIEKPKV